MKIAAKDAFCSRRRVCQPLSVFDENNSNMGLLALGKKEASYPIRTLRFGFGMFEGAVLTEESYFRNVPFRWTGTPSNWISPPFRRSAIISQKRMSRVNLVIPMFDPIPNSPMYLAPGSVSSISMRNSPFFSALAFRSILHRRKEDLAIGHIVMSVAVDARPVGYGEP